MAAITETAVPRRNLFWVAAIPLAICIALLLAITTTTPAWTVWYAELLGLYAIAALAAWRWPNQARFVLRYGAVTVALAVLIFGQPYNGNATGSLLALFIPWMLPFKSWLDFVALGIVGAALYGTESAGAVLAVVAGFALLIAWSYDRQPNTRRVPWRLFVVMLCALIAGSLIGVLQPATTQARLDHWQEAQRLAYERQWMGWGLGSYLERSTIPDQNHADSLPFTIMAELGGIGFVLFVDCAYDTVRRIFITQNNPARLAVLIWGLHNIVDCTLWFPAVGVLLAVNLALLWRFGDADQHPAN